MANVFRSGFELNSVAAANPEFSSTSGSPTISTTTIRSGTYAGRISSLSSGTPKYFRYQTPSLSHLYNRFYLNIATLPSAENTIFLLNDLQSFTTPAVYVTLDNTGALRLYDEDGQVGSASSALSTGTWYRIEVKLDRSGAGGSHIVEAKIDGTNFASASNRNVGQNIASVNWGGNLLSEAQTAGDWFFDDIAINDSTGSFQTSYPGEGRIIHLKPNGNGDTSQWTVGTGASSHYTYVDEVTPNDNTSSDYLLSSTIGQTDEFTLESSGLTNETITLVSIFGRFSGTNITTNRGIQVRIKASSGGTVENSSTIQPNSNTFFSNQQAAPRTSPLTLYDLPGASTTPWTPSDLATAQIGVEVVSGTGTANVEVSTLHLIVEYGPAAPTLQTILGQARIEKSVTQTVLGRARIEKSVIQTIQGLSRITKSVAQTILGKADILKSTTQTILGKADILKSATQTILGRARIALVTNQTILGKARITVSTLQAILGKARITATTSRTITGIADILKTTTRTIQGIARIVITNSQTILGRARIQKSVSQTILGRARITTIVTQTILGRARITKVVTQTVLGLARVAVNTTRTITGKARITVSVTQTILGRARITVTTLRTILGRSRIEKSVSQIIQGIARITTSVTQTISGKANILIVHGENILGRSRITATTTRNITGVANIQVIATLIQPFIYELCRYIEENSDGRFSFTAGGNLAVGNLQRDIDGVTAVQASSPDPDFYTQTRYYNIDFISRNETTEGAYNDLRYIYKLLHKGYAYNTENYHVYFSEVTTPITDLDRDAMGRRNYRFSILFIVYNLNS